MGVKVRLLREYKHLKPGFIMETSAGVANLLVDRFRPQIAEYVTLVPEAPGLGQAVAAIANALNPPRKGKK